MSICWAVSPKDMFNRLSKGHYLQGEKRSIKRFYQGIKKHLLCCMSPKDLQLQNWAAQSNVGKSRKPHSNYIYASVSTVSHVEPFHT